MRALAVISGIGLIILWFAGLSTPGSAVWLTWLDGVGAVFSFLVAGSARTRAGEAGTSLITALGLFGLWIIGLATNGLPYQNWWTFAFACVMSLATIAGYAETRKSIRTGTADIDVESRDRFRRSA